MNKKQIAKVLQEVINRSEPTASASSSVNLLQNSFPAQTEFLQDTSRLKAALCTRRAGKSMAAGLDLFQAALTNPGTSCLYIALTRASAKNIMWKDVLKTINKQFNLRAQFNESALTVTLPNGSIIYLTGADANKNELEKILGQKFKLVYIDEAASFRIDLRELVYKTLRPAIIDLQGTICLIGTPSNLKKSLFHDITTNKERGWSVHNWSATDNPYVKQQFEEELQSILEDNPRFLETPTYEQMYLGKWSTDSEKLVYRFNYERNITHTPPTDLTSYILGVDLGFDDATAFSLCGYNNIDNVFYVLETHKKSKLIYSQVAEAIQEYMAKYPNLTIVVDGAAKQGVQEISQRYNLDLISTDKHHKHDFINIMNDQFITDKIKLVASTTETLTTEYENLVLDDRSLLPKEHPSCDNHLCDATLYAWRYSYSYVAKPTKPKKKPVHTYDPEDEEDFRQKSQSWWETY